MQPDFIERIETKLSDIDATLMILADALSKTNEQNFVGKKIGFKIQLETYEPVWVEAWGQFNCDIEDKEAVFKELTTHLQTEVSKERKQIEAYKKSRKEN